MSSSFDVPHTTAAQMRLRKNGSALWISMLCIMLEWIKYVRGSSSVWICSHEKVRKLTMHYLVQESGDMIRLLQWVEPQSYTYGRLILLMGFEKRLIEEKRHVYITIHATVNGTLLGTVDLDDRKNYLKEYYVHMENILQQHVYKKMKNTYEKKLFMLEQCFFYENVKDVVVAHDDFKKYIHSIRHNCMSMTTTTAAAAKTSTFTNFPSFYQSVEFLFTDEPKWNLWNHNYPKQHLGIENNVQDGSQQLPKENGLWAVPELHPLVIKAINHIRSVVKENKQQQTNTTNSIFYYISGIQWVMMKRVFNIKLNVDINSIPIRDISYDADISTPFISSLYYGNRLFGHIKVYSYLSTRNFVELEEQIVDALIDANKTINHESFKDVLIEGLVWWYASDMNLDTSDLEIKVEKILGHHVKAIRSGGLATKLVVLIPRISVSNLSNIIQRWFEMDLHQLKPNVIAVEVSKMDANYELVKVPFHVSICAYSILPTPHRLLFAFRVALGCICVIVVALLILSYFVMSYSLQAIRWQYPQFLDSFIQLRTLTLNLRLFYPGRSRSVNRPQVTIIDTPPVEEEEDHEHVD